MIFFGDDPERWIFVLPLAWTLVAAADAGGRLARAFTIYLLLVNAATTVVPAIVDTTPRWRAQGVEALVEPEDLVISPGHDWDEQIGFYGPREVHVWPIAYYVGARGRDAALDELLDQIRWAR